MRFGLFGQICTAPGMVKNTYGTGCFILMTTGSEAVPSAHNLLTTVAWKLDGRTTYALEGSIFIAGAVVQWLRDGLGLVADAAETQAAAESVPDTGGVYVVPAFVGLGFSRHSRWKSRPNHPEQVACGDHIQRRSAVRRTGRRPAGRRPVSSGRRTRISSRTSNGGKAWG